MAEKIKKANPTLVKVKLEALRNHVNELKAQKKNIDAQIKECNSLILDEKASIRKPKVEKPKASIAPRKAVLIKFKPSPELAEIVGDYKRTKPTIMQAIWSYIKKNNLQNEKNKRIIDCDAKLKALTGKSKISMYDLGSTLSRHLTEVED